MIFYLDKRQPKGTILQEVGALLERRQYRIKSLNLINFKKSMKYNPLAYIRSEKDILKLVNALILNTKGEGEKSSEDFWVKAERLYYSALIGYIWYEAEPEERNFITLLDLINASEAREDDEEFQSRKPPSPLVFLPISTHFTATPVIPLSSPALQPTSIQSNSHLESRTFTPDLAGRLRALYAQSFRTTLAPYVLPRLLARS